MKPIRIWRRVCAVVGLGLAAGFLVAPPPGSPAEIHHTDSNVVTR